MGLLDELKQQATAVQQNDALERERKAANVAQIQPAMSRVYEYYRVLAEQLKVVCPNSPHTYRIFGVGELNNAQMLDAATRSRTQQIDGVYCYEYIEFAVNWRAGAPLQVAYTSVNEAQYLKERLWRFGCKVDEKIVKNADGKMLRIVLTISPEFPTRLRFESDIAAGTVKLNLRNLEDFIDDWQVLTPDQCSPALFEELAKALLGKPHQLKSLLPMYG